MGAYSTVSFSKQPQASKEAALYAQVVFATDQQEEASASALYAQVDEKRKKNNKKKEEDTPHEPDHLYAQVDKKSTKKKEDSPPPELDQLYAQVGKKKRKKREKEEIEEVPPGDVYSVVNKPSAPPVATSQVTPPHERTPAKPLNVYTHPSVTLCASCLLLTFFP